MSLSAGPANGSPGPSPGGKGPSGAADAPKGEAGDGPPPKPARAPRKKDPKLDLDLLEAEGGFNDIWHKMAPAFKATFQGEGHEVADLRRLLELYQRWQARFYPYCDFDTFVLKLEKAGRSKTMKAKMGSMRQNLLGLIFPTVAEEEANPGAALPAQPAAAGPATGGPAAAGAQTPAAAAGQPQQPRQAAAAAGADDDFDDELVAMQRDAEWEAAYAVMDELETGPVAARPAAAAAAGAGAAAAGAAPSGSGAGAAAGAMELDYDELVQLAEEMQPIDIPPPPPVAAAAGAAAPGAPGQGNYMDPDEELMALAMEPEEEEVAAAPPPPQAAVPAAGADPRVVGPGLVNLDEDEELRRLADMDGDEAVGAAAAAATTGPSGEAGTGAAAAAGAADTGLVNLDEDEELRRLAEMDTEDVLGSGGGGGQGGAAAAATTAAGEDAPMDVDGAAAGSAQLDKELLALAADTQLDSQAQTVAGGGGGPNLSANRSGVSPPPPEEEKEEEEGGLAATQVVEETQECYGAGVLRGILMTQGDGSQVDASQQ